MRIAVVQTYPIYHDLISTEQWIKKDTRDLLIPTILSEMGHEVELWAVGTEAASIPMKGYELKVFRPDREGGRTKFHTSDTMVKHAQAFSPDACLLKGVDGGVGTHLIKHFLLRNRVPYSFIIGGEYYSKYVKRASCMLVESAKQYALLTSPPKFWHAKYPSHRIVPLSKTVNLDHFSPATDAEKTWDVITSGRLIPNYKNYTVLDVLPSSVRIAVVGGGPMLEELKKTYPAVDWLGHVPHSEVVGYLQKSKIFIYTSTKDYFPRSISEAIACGLPTVAVKGNLSHDVISPDRGIISSLSDLKSNVLSLLADEERLKAMSANCRAFALEEFDASNLLSPLQQALDLMKADGNSAS